MRTSEQRHGLALARADAAGDRAASEVRRLWAHLLAALRASATFHDARTRVWPILAAMRQVPAWSLAASLAAQARWAQRSERAWLGRAVPRARLLAVVRKRDVRESFDWQALLARLHPVVSETNILDLLFPPPSEARVNEIVFGTGWAARLAAATSLASPEALAPRIATGVMLGRTWREIAKDILPAVQGVQVSARRIARTEGLRVAREAQMDCHAQLGDLVIGYKIHATLDGNTRPEHRARDGTIYYADPGPGQKGYDEMPRPPYEADGKPAFNCRCFLTPVLRD